jgi:hypothetical protein
MLIITVIFPYQKIIKADEGNKKFKFIVIIEINLNCLISFKYINVKSSLFLQVKILLNLNV